MVAIFRCLLTVALFIQTIFSLQAQSTEGREFWFTFGRVGQTPIEFVHLINMQIRIVGGSEATSVSLYFTELGKDTAFTILPYEVFTYVLNQTQKEAVYNTTIGVTDKSVYITANKPVSVYALSMWFQHFDVTNVLPVSALGIDYYHFSHYLAVNCIDAYAVVGTQNNTQLFHNGGFLGVLNAGEVYYNTFTSDMTGAHITSDKPIAFFSLNESARVAVPLMGGCPPSNLFQQLAPVNTWGKRFFVPVTLTNMDIVRIVASQNNTNITQSGGVIRTDVPNAQTSLNNLQAGKFVELIIYADSAGCLIEADKPIGVCSYIKCSYVNGLYTSPAITWVPGTEQTIFKVLTSPFIPNSISFQVSHYVLLSTPTATKESTKVSVGGGPLLPLSGGNWVENAKAGFSFYNFPYTDFTASYIFTNPNGMILFGYGAGSTSATSYYYLAGSAMRDLEAAFYVNNISHQELQNATIYCGFDVHFRAEIEGLHPNPDRLRWYVDGVERTVYRDQETWSENLPVGEYEIAMWVRYETNTEKTVTGTLKIHERWVKMRNVKR